MRIKQVAKRTAKARRKDVAKRQGTFVARAVLNGADWAKWAASAGVPNPVPADKLHVTVVNSPIEVKMKPDDDPYSVTTDRACACLLGPAENVFAIVFESWMLWDRFYDWYGAGALGSWESYRPHLSLSYDAAGFDISDEAMASMPDMIILGPELVAGQGEMIDFANADMLEGGDADEGDMGDDPAIVITEIYCSETRKALTAGMVKGDLGLMDEYALREVIRRKAATPGAIEVLKSVGLAAPEGAPQEPARSDEASRVEAPAGKKLVEREVKLTVRQLPAEMTKSAAAASLFKSMDEEHLVYGWASVSTVKGELVEDLQGDTITVKAQREFAHSLMRGQREGKFEHMGKSVNEVVEILVLDAELQKALGIDLGMEGMIAGTYVPDEKDWDLVKSGDWMYSIAGTVIVLEDE